MAAPGGTILNRNGDVVRGKTLLKCELKTSEAIGSNTNHKDPLGEIDRLAFFRAPTARPLPWLVHIHHLGWVYTPGRALLPYIIVNGFNSVAGILSSRIL